MGTGVLSFHASTKSLTGNLGSESASSQSGYVGVTPVEGTKHSEEPLSTLLDDVRSVYGQPSHRLTELIDMALQASESCQEAIGFIEQSQIMNSDIEMQRAQSFVYEMLPYRNLEEGTALVVASLAMAFINMAGTPFDKKQILCVDRILKGVYSSPFMSVDKAVDFTIDMEDCGFVMDSSGLNIIFEDALESGFASGE
jgi:hypothetical protein